VNSQKIHKACSTKSVTPSITVF